MTGVIREVQFNLHKLAEAGLRPRLIRLGADDFKRLKQELEPRYAYLADLHALGAQTIMGVPFEVVEYGAGVWVEGSR